MKKKTKSNKRWKEDLAKKELWRPLQYVLGLEIIMIVVGLLLEMIFGNKIYYFCMHNQSISYIIKFYDLFVNVNSVLAAIVIFFYSVQDSKKVGIPNRTILTYSFGSFAVPLFFIMAMCLLPFTLLLLNFNMIIVSIITLAIVFGLQMLIVVIILISTSYKFSYDIICNVEVKCYKKLCEKSSYNAKSKKFLKTNYANSLYHFEQIIMSDELTTIKMGLIKRLLCVPFYDKKRVRIKEICKKGNVYNGNVEKKCLEQNDLFVIYKFYYENLFSAMEYLSKKENNIERNKVYLVLYELLEEIKETYEKTTKSEKIKKNYLMTVSGILNAVLDSDAMDKEAFSNYVFNECIEDMEIWREQIGLYFLFQEYLYRTHIERNEICQKIKLDKLLNIRGILQWTLIKKMNFYIMSSGKYG